MRRREFLLLLPVSVACTTTIGKQPRLRVLVLGGTNFVGPHLVQAALDRGHVVTMFNRGRTNPQWFPSVEKLRGDRLAPGGAGLAALRGDRRWDLVIDTWAQAPGVVGESVSLLRDRAGIYAYISSIAVYGQFRKIGLTEEDATVSTRSIQDPMDASIPYPLAKRRAEELIAERHPRPLILRATSINGLDRTGDPHNQQSYWPLRMIRGGEVLAPGDGKDPFQYIDVKDLALFTIKAAERGLTGIYNMVGPEQPIGFGRYLQQLQRTASSQASLTAVPASFLLRAGVAPFEDLPSWIPADDPEPGFFQISNAKAVAAGLTYRPLEDTLRDVVSSLRPVEAPPNVAGGLSLDREKEVLSRWRAERS